jgi:hypothetical protein
MSESTHPGVPAAEAPASDESKTPPADDDQAAEEGDGYGYAHLDDLALEPFRIHPLVKVGDRLSSGNLQIPMGLQNAQKRFSLDSKISSFSSRSRSRSPSLRSGKDRATITTQDGNSSISSLEEFVDSDILYDKLGFLDYDKDSKNKQNYHQHSHSYTFGDNTSRPINLTPVSERMSEDTMEDVHAFTDISANTNTRASSSVGTGGSTSVGGEVSSHVLEPLDEGDEDLESSDDDEKEGHIIVTNLENITLQQSESVEDDGAKTPKTDASSVRMM